MKPEHFIFVQSMGLTVTAFNAWKRLLRVHPQMKVSADIDYLYVKQESNSHHHNYYQHFIAYTPLDFLPHRYS